VPIAASMINKNFFIIVAGLVVIVGFCGGCGTDFDIGDASKKCSS
jgi:hypothetical protein